MNEYIESRNASEITIKEQTSKSDGLQSRLVELMENIVESSDYQPDYTPDISDAAMLMAADGYGRGKVVGEENGVEAVVKTSDSQKSFSHDKEPNPNELANAAKAQFDKVTKERDMRH